MRTAWPALVAHPSIANSRVPSPPRLARRLSISSYFQTGSAEPDPRSRDKLTAAITAAKATANIDISVVGHADATGSDSYNSALSLRRAQSVRNILVAEGVPSDVIEIAYHGANNPLVPTPRGVPELRNRRVEVTIR